MRVRQIIGVCVLTALACLANAADRGLEYGDRGDRHEGIRARPVGGGDIELISVRVDYQEPTRGMPDRLKVRFHLREASKVYLTVRELEYHHYYWLDQIQPRTPWRTGFGNVFEWPTNAVLQKLTGMAVYDLGVVARIGVGEEMAHERIAPAILYHSEAPQSASAYLFTAKMNTPATLNCTVYPAGADRVLFRQPLPLVHAGNIFTCRWDAASSKEGSYRMVISGYSLDTNDTLNKIIDFYHQPAIR